eukprot:358286-Chlamydomonas_euryale.AAC.4
MGVPKGGEQIQTDGWGACRGAADEAGCDGRHVVAIPLSEQQGRGVQTCALLARRRRLARGGCAPGERVCTGTRAGARSTARLLAHTRYTCNSVVSECLLHPPPSFHLIESCKTLAQTHNTSMPEGHGNCGGMCGVRRLQQCRGSRATAAEPPFCGHGLLSALVVLPFALSPGKSKEILMAQGGMGCLHPHHAWAACIHTMHPHQASIPRERGRAACVIGEDAHFHTAPHTGSEPVPVDDAQHAHVLVRVVVEVHHQWLLRCCVSTGEKHCAAGLEEDLRQCKGRRRGSLRRLVTCRKEGGEKRAAQQWRGKWEGEEEGSAAVETDWQSCRRKISCSRTSMRSARCVMSSTVQRAHAQQQMTHRDADSGADSDTQNHTMTHRDADSGA